MMFVLTFVLICCRNQEMIMNNDPVDQNSVFALYDCKIDVSKKELIKKASCLDCGKARMIKDVFLPRAHNTEPNLTFPFSTSFMIRHHIKLTPQ